MADNAPIAVTHGLHRVSASISPLNPATWQQRGSTRICVLDAHSDQTTEQFIRQQIFSPQLAELLASAKRGRFAIMELASTGEVLRFAHDIDELIAMLLKRAGECSAGEPIEFQIDSRTAREALIGTLELLSARAGRTLLQKARTRSIFIATPIARQPVHQYALALAETLPRLQALNIRATVQCVVGSSNLARARNTLAAQFMASDYEDMLFIDDDIGFAPTDVVRLLGSDLDVIAGVGCRRSLTGILPDTHPAKWIVGTLDALPIADDATGAIEVAALGLGFMRIRRAVFSRMKMAHPEWKRRGAPDMPERERAEYYQYFRFDPDDPEERSEDVAFCHAWRDLGGKVWADPAIKLLHIGEHEFGGDFGSMIQALRAGT